MIFFSGYPLLHRTNIIFFVFVTGSAFRFATGTMSAAAVVKFLLGAVTDFALVPSLYQVAKRKRHFEMFIGVSQVIAAFLFNTCAAFGHMNIFLTENDWHFLSDVLSLSYVCCLLVHALAIPTEDVNIVLRYVAFGLSWVFKTRDSWNEGWWEGALVATYAIAVVARVTKTPFLLIHFQFRPLIVGAFLLVLVGIKAGYPSYHCDSEKGVFSGLFFHID